MNKYASTALLSTLALGCQSAWGAGFAIIEHSASGMGTAFAGSGSSAEDASGMFFNPATISFVEGTELVTAAHYIRPEADFTNDGSSWMSPLSGVPLNGPDSNGGEQAYVANTYLVGNLNEQWKYGVGINAPFGLSTDYDDGWVGRYHALRSSLRTVNINPVLSWQPSEHLAMAFGINSQYVDVELSSAIDTRTIVSGTPAQDLDGKAVITGDNWAWGWNAGLLYQLSDTTRLGLSYRSVVSHDVDGHADFTVPVDLSPYFLDTNAHASVEMPANLNFSVFHQYNDRLALMADATLTQWSVFDELRIRYDNPAQPDSVTTENWDDSWRIALGAHYQYNDRVLLRGGVAWDQTPIPDAEHRTARIPGNDRTWLALGVGYDLSDRSGLDIGIAHLLVQDTHINNTLEGSLTHTLTGDYASSVDIFSIQLRHRF